MTYYVESEFFPCGKLTVVSDGEAVTEIFRGDPKLGVQRPNETTRKAIDELREYFLGERREFDLLLRPEKGATNFRRSVWNALLSVPFGETVSYGELAGRLGNPKACRAVGGAVGANPILIMIPCHRVVAKNGVGGFSSGADMKNVLLSIEGYR